MTQERIAKRNDFKNNIQGGDRPPVPKLNLSQTQDVQSQIRDISENTAGTSLN